MVVGPHAGYVYSGPIAGSAYQTLEGHGDVFERVVLIGPSHRVWFQGIAIASVDAFGTPLGDVPLCAAARRTLVDQGLAVVDDGPHAQEHGLEVHLPFLMATLGRFALVPLVVGEATDGAVEAALAPFVREPRTLVVVSTDLSHFLDHETARRRDLATASAVESLDGSGIGPRDACGWLALRGALRLARRQGLEIERLDLRDSSDTAGEPARVVGYGAWALWGSP